MAVGLYTLYYPYCHFLALHKTYGTLRKNQEEQVLSCAKVRTRYKIVLPTGARTIQVVILHYGMV